MGTAVKHLGMDLGVSFVDIDVNKLEKDHRKLKKKEQKKQKKERKVDPESHHPLVLIIVCQGKIRRRVSPHLRVLLLARPARKGRQRKARSTMPQVSKGPA